MGYVQYVGTCHASRLFKGRAFYWQMMLQYTDFTAVKLELFKSFPVIK